MQVDCPTCKTKVEWHNKNEFRPFCSKRCQLIDLGEWSNESHVISEQSKSDPDLTEKPEIDVEEIEAMLAQQNQSFFKE
ncbi:DNA gyrase inhibitor YacG [Aliiglaciecola sp. M165]|uniref:DNA gyrase inhibitor YacG n=1 Tax=Aliiglaciecola sp. M165 TaxID=2593649 RepID=UPI00117DE776|nr:DNA gyrase inhibitor YacG [Aliiglaciecola sp. M165]TRY30608.1 DNA gyrase inhibitor YacG [Aliiglaciecola sp. M165]